MDECIYRIVFALLIETNTARHVVPSMYLYLQCMYCEFKRFVRDSTADPGDPECFMGIPE